MNFEVLFVHLKNNLHHQKVYENTTYKTLPLPWYCQAVFQLLLLQMGKNQKLVQISWALF